MFAIDLAVQYNCSQQQNADTPRVGSTGASSHSEVNAMPEQIVPPTKCCTKCGNEYPLTSEHFKSYSLAPDGFRNTCIACRNPPCAAYGTPRKPGTSNRSVLEQDKIRYERRKRLIANNTKDFSRADRRRCFEYWGYRCAYCERPHGLLRSVRLSTDHWIPIGAEDCPGTIPGNIVPACGSCNASKKDKDPIEWLNDKFGHQVAANKIAEIRAYFAFVTK